MHNSPIDPTPTTVAIYFNYADIWFRQTALERARNGSLSPSWREDLTLPDTVSISGASVEGFLMAIGKIRQMPYAAWEPGHAPDWRTALGAWYSDSRVLLTRSYVDNARQHAVAMVTADRLISNAIGSSERRGEATLQNQLTSKNSVDETTDAARRFLEQMYLQTRDRLSASYLAGLAAGGEEVDWIQWFEARVAHWPHGDSGARQVTAEINDPSFRGQLERLPAYWTVGPQESMKNRL